jgi:hypothetical protein
MPDLSFGSYTLPVFLYENFSYVISNAVNPSSVEKPITRSSGLAAGLFSDTSSNFTFAGNGTSLTAGSTESFSYVVKDGLGNSYTSSNQVPVGAGRLTDLNGNSVSGNRYEFYKNQPIQRIQMKAPFILCNSVLSVPSLPPGLQFYTSGSNLDISGTPLVTLPTSNYLIIAKDATTGSKIVTTSNTFVVSNEQILFDLCGSPIITMTVDTPISPRILTAQFPPYPSGGTLKYTWQTFPDGLTVNDVFGNDKTVSNSVGFLTTDPSHVFAISGTPSLAAAYAYATIPPNPVQRSIQGQRVNPLPTLTSNYPLTFSFAETVLFDPVTVPTLYTSNTVDASSIFFRAATYFSSGAGTAISNIFSPDLRSDLSLVFIPSLSRADLSGTPLSAGTADYTIRAINSNGTTRDYTRTFTISNDSITFSSPVGTDLCYSFILSRPVDLAKTGYYPSNIQFRATAASGRTVSLSAPALTGTGLSLNSNGVITGIPSSVTPLSTLSVTATAAGSPASATRDISFSILNDVFTFADISASSLSFIQNVPITPFQVSVTTLSERNVLNYSEIGFPSGLSINPAGLVSGTSLGGNSGTVAFGATTGYASGTRNYNYTVTPDSMLFLGPKPSYSYTAGQTITPIEIDAFVYSGVSVDRFDLSLIPSYGLDVSSTTGTFSGTWTTGIPPGTVLPASCNFTINATAGSFVQSLPVDFTADPVLIPRMFFSTLGTNISGTLCSIPVTDVSAIKLHTSSESSFSDIQFTTTSALSNDVILATTSGGSVSSEPGLVYSASNLHTGALTFNSGTNIDISGANISSLTRISDSNWRVGGRRQSAIDASAILYVSTNDGQSWSLNSQYITGVKTRDDGSNFLNNPYLQGGLALRAKDGILMAGGLGGNVMVRSVDDGATWNTVTNGFLGESAYFNLDDPTVWIATGSDYTSLITTDPPFTSPTIKYSTNLGLTWSNVLTGPFNLYGYEVVYGNNTWLATGVSFDLSGATYLYTPELRTSINGSNWTRIPFFSDLFSSNQTSNIIKAPLRLGSMAFDGSNWNVFVNVENQIGSIVSIPRLYQHPASGSLLTGWTSVDLSSSFTSIGVTVDSNLRAVSMTTPKLVFDENPPIDITLNFTLGAGTGPTLTSPTTLNFSQYQYIPITPIQLAATGTGTVYFFVPSANLPPGLTFNQFTNQLTGTPASIGNYTMTFYAKDSIGASTFTMSFTFIIPRVIRTQDGAGAYTSLLRQYTTVLGAQNARDQVVLPTQERGLGEFMSPPAPDVITAVIDPRCKNPNC